MGGGGGRRGHCAEGGGGTLSTWPLTTWQTGGEKKAGQLPCGWNATMRRVGAAPGSIHLNINQFIQQQMQGIFPGGTGSDTIYTAALHEILYSSLSSWVVCQNVSTNSHTLSQTLNYIMFRLHIKFQIVSRERFFFFFHKENNDQKQHLLIALSWLKLCTRAATVLVLIYRLQLLKCLQLWPHRPRIKYQTTTKGFKSKQM